MRMLRLESTENLKRVENLLGMYELSVNSELGDESERSDILRAAVVLLHASIEETVRNLFVSLLPRGRVEYLNELPYPPYGNLARSKGVLLGDLLKNHGGNFVENVVFEAINAYVDTLNINNSEQLVAQLRKVDIRSEPLRPFLENIDKIMKRRHQIVHQMDREEALDPDARPVAEIVLHDVKVWLASVQDFTAEIIKQTPD